MAQDNNDWNSWGVAIWFLLIFIQLMCIRCDTARIADAVEEAARHEQR